MATDDTVTIDSRDNLRHGISIGTLVPFFAFTFVLTWGIATLLILFTDQLEAIFGELSYTNPLFILAVYAPGIVGVCLVFRHYGLSGLSSFFRRLTLWRMPIRWWAFLILGIPAIFFLGAAITGSITAPFPFSPWYGVLPALGLALSIGPIEELGWRGIALPLLQRRFAPLWASLILGAVWGLWHVPAFLLSGVPQEAWSFGRYFIGVVSLAVIVTPMFNAARGSLLVAVLFHFQMNSPLWPDIHPWDSILFAASAVVIVVLNRKTLLSRDRAVTEVLMPGDEVRAGWEVRHDGRQS